MVKAANEKDFDRTFAPVPLLIQKLMPIYDMDTNASILKKLLVHRDWRSATAVCPSTR